MKRCAVWALVVACGSFACGGEPAAEPKTADAVSPTASEPAPALEAPAATDAPAPSAPAAEPAPPAPKAADRDAPRDVKYVVTPEGLRVDVAGVRFLASAQAKQVAQGWGVKISIKAESTDGAEHALLSPKNGPIAFAAAVFKKGSTEAERIPDAREGEGELKVGPGAPVTFTRDFPSRGGRVLAIGEALDLEVGLWGLGSSADDRRPVKQFVHVTMKVEKGKPKALVEPPASAGR